MMEHTTTLALYILVFVIFIFDFGMIVLFSMVYMSSIRVVNSKKMTSNWGRKSQYVYKFPRLIHLYPYQKKTIPNENIRKSDNHDSNAISMKNNWPTSIQHRATPFTVVDIAPQNLVHQKTSYTTIVDRSKMIHCGEPGIAPRMLQLPEDALI